MLFLDYQQSKRLTKWIVILPIFAILITSLLFVNFFIKQQRENYEKDFYEAKIEIIKSAKKEAQAKIIDVNNFIESNKKLLTKESQDEIKNITNVAINIMQNIYDENKEQSKEEIIFKIKEKLRGLKFFDNLSGYFFIYDLDGTCLLLPTNENLENTNLINLQDAKKKFQIKDMIDIVTNEKEGFEEWYWHKPHEKTMKKKIGFVKIFEPLGIFIGTARYEEDIFESIKNQIKKLLINTRFGNNGYIFAYDYEGNVISHIKKEYIGQNRWNVVIENFYLVQSIIKGARQVDDGFFMSYTSSYNPNSKKKGITTSFIKDIPDFSWVIGTGVYYENILTTIKEKGTLLEYKLEEAINKIILMTIIILLIVTVAMLIIFVKFRKVLKKFQKDLIDKSNQSLKQKEQLVYQLEHDTLTGIPNRILLSKILENSIKSSKRNNKKIALMFIDINNFKSVNDSLGHDAGDDLLKEFSARLVKSIRESDVAARLSGDKFIVLIENSKSIQNIKKVVEKIQKAMKESLVLNGVNYNMSVSIGISTFPQDGEDSKTLLKNADIAMYRAKDDGQNKYRFFTSKINDEIQNQIEIENSLYVALKNNEFILHYQPLVEARSGKIVGVEALIRWQHPTKGLIYPDEFIAIAEESNLIVDIGNKVIEEACKQMSRWKAKGYAIERISINLAARQLDNLTFIDFVKNTLEETSCRPEWVEMEIIERYAMKNPIKTIEVLNRLRKMDIDIAIDDFGTGHSSLAYIKQFPITKLKIDRAFISNILDNYKDQAIVETIIALGSGLRMKVLAEGVERIEEKEFLLKQNCTLIQGYLFSKPLPLDEIEVLLEKGVME